MGSLDSENRADDSRLRNARRDAVPHGRRNPALDSVRVGFVERDSARVPLRAAGADPEAAHEAADARAPCVRSS
jgi:hypothetical protein